MAMVCLSNMLEEDKNLHGLIPKTVEFTKVTLHDKLSPDGRKYLEDCVKNSKTLEDLTKHEKFNTPEWTFRPSGAFAAWDCGMVDGEMVTLDAVTVDVMDWIARQSNDIILAIADCEFNTWNHEGTGAHLIFHPRYKSEYYDGGRVRYEKQWNKFIDNVNAYRKEHGIEAEPLLHAEAYKDMQGITPEELLTKYEAEVAYHTTKIVGFTKLWEAIQSPEVQAALYKGRDFDYVNNWIEYSTKDRDRSLAKIEKLKAKIGAE